MMAVVNMASASGPVVGEECIASLKDAANWAVMKLRYTRGVKEEQLEVVVAFLSGTDVLPFFLLDLGRVSAMHACLLLSSC